MKMSGKYLILCISLVFKLVETSHFRGGTISWKPTGNGNEVRFSFKLGWAYGRGPGCTPSNVGQLVTGHNSSYWQCTSGCNGTVNLANTNYICTGASVSDNWEQGENTFTYTFSGIGPYTVEFTGGAWVSLDFGSAGSWSVGAIVYLGNRSDTHYRNRSPVTTGKPMYTVQYGCQATIRIPVVDDDGDTVRCRWSTGSECVSICNALPSATIDSNTCTISFPANHTSNGIYAVAVSVEDYPKSTMTIETQVYTTSTKMSTVNLQFLVQTPNVSGNCNDKPRFISPTPVQGSTIQTTTLQIFRLSFYVTSTRSITKIDITSPAGMTYTSLQSVPSQPGSVFVATSWTPQENQIGIHIVCALAEDSIRKTSDSRCINVNVNDGGPCLSGPCRSNGTCVRNGLTQNYTCTCVPGFTGRFCEIEIIECTSQPCQNNGTCLDLINKFECQCVPGYTGSQCETDINECSSLPCQNGGTCLDQINRFECQCVAGYTGTQCEIDIDECLSGPCQNGGTCLDLINRFECQCVAGYTGSQCETDINECSSGPCQNNGTCLDLINRLECQCVAGYTGNQCEIDINECSSGPCQNGGTCLDQINNFECLCVTGYTGHQCETDINECSSGPCQNGGTCLDLINRFECQCVAGYTGTECEIGINECTSGPCQNGGTCLDLINMFECQCVPGFTGNQCEIDINECTSGPCHNGGTCLDLINRFKCQCVLGYTGTQCEIDINECDPSPCIFLFDCENRINGHQCNLIEWKLALIILSFVMLSLIAICGFTYIFKRKKYKNMKDNWLANFVGIDQADVQPRVLFTRKFKSGGFKHITEE
nr:protein jagged-1a-like isoform X6 [Crassostrea gigas]